MGHKTAAFLLLSLTACFGFVLTADAGAARYAVAQCGWHVGQDASWFDTSADRFVRSSYCQTPDGADPFDGVHLTSQTRDSAAAIGGSRFARWRWQAPRGTGIVTVHGQRWHVLKDGFQHRLGSVSGSGFNPFLQFDSTDTAKRDFAGNFSPFAEAVESRLLCARPEDRTCSAETNSISGVRVLTFTLDDPERPVTAISGGLTGSSWLRGSQGLTFSARDVGSGLRYSQTLIDGAVRAETEHRCDKTRIAGQWRGTKMQPCGTSATGSQSISTSSLSDGTHQLRQCAVDFAGNSGCLADRTVRTDNTAPGAPRDLNVAGGDSWHRSNGFRLDWSSPDQGSASPLFGYAFRVRGGAGFDSGPVPGGGTGPATVFVPAAGEYRATVWLIDQAGNSNPAATAEATIRFDDVPPTAWFEQPAVARPRHLRVPVSDVHSGVAGGRISYRRSGSSEWNQLPTELTGDSSGLALQADFPSEEVPAGIYEFQAVVLDRAGNPFVTGRRGNGSPLTLKAPVTMTSSLTARLVRGHRSALSLKVGFGETARLAGRLTGPEGSSLAGQNVEVTQNPAFGSRTRPQVESVITGRDGYFSLELGRGANRRVSVRFAGTERFSEAAAGPLRLKVKGSIGLRVTPRRLLTGERVKLRGKVKAAWARRPARGHLVAIQYFETDTGKWRPVMVVRTGRHGRFNAKYRFRYITGSARIRLRAVLLPSQYFPYEPAVSKPVRIEVEG